MKAVRSSPITLRDNYVGCSTQVKEPFRSPLIGSPRQNSTGRKRKSDTALTPLRSPSVVKSLHSNSAEDEKERLRKDAQRFNFCGLPPDVQAKYKDRRKITDLYDWQKACLSDHRLLRGSNFIVSLPTGAGKTLIAEILMLKEAIKEKRSSILVLPYVAIVQEKISSLACLEEEFGIHIEEYAANKGRLPPIQRRRGSSIYVATIEKANMLINSLIEADRLDSIGLIIVDELHMLGDGSRGATLEQLLIKYLYKGDGQIVGLSATLSNISQLSTFLRATVFSTSFRPVELDEFVRIGQMMWKVLPSGELEDGTVIKKMGSLNNDPDGICHLLMKIIPEKSVIIFCPTKKNCENVATMIATNLPKGVRERKSADKKKLIASMKEDNDGNLDSSLERLLLSGISYHHSGLTHDERKHIEAAYAEGLLCVICATSTLAAGVNLPARRVIIKAPFVGRNPLSKSQYLQMVGRAGRAGFDQKGDSITIVRAGMEERQFREMLQSPMMSCISSLTGSYLSSFILDLISLKLASSIDEIMRVLRYSLLVAQNPIVEVRQSVENVVSDLTEKHLIEIDKNSLLVSTQLGCATFLANFEPDEACRLSDDLIQTLNKGIVFSSHFHLLFTISPYDAACDVNWDIFHIEYKSLTSAEKTLLASCGLKEGYIIQSITSRCSLKAGEPPMRLYIALMLQRVWNQETPWSVSEKFGVERGWLQSVLQNSVSRAAAIARFSEKQQSLWPLRLLLPELVQRLSDCVRVELLPLLAIDAVKRGRAKQLYAAGLKTVADVAKCEVEDLVKRIEHMNKFQAVKIINSAKALLRDQIDEKLEEMESLGLHLSDQLLKPVFLERKKDQQP